MEENSKLPSLIFEDMKKTYMKGETISCFVVLKNFQHAEEDWIGLYADDLSGLTDRIDYRLVKEGSLVQSEDGESDKIAIRFKETNFQAGLFKKFFFKYVNADSEVVAESSKFEIEDGTVSCESFLTIQAADSFDETMVLVNKMSTGKVTRMEEDFKKLYSQMAEAKKQIDKQNDYCEILEKEIKKKEAEYDDEREQRCQAENAVEKLGRGMANQMHVIEEQGQRLETLGRKLSREEKLNVTLKEEIEGQRTVFEESSVEYEQLKMKAINFKTECKHAKKLLQDERELFTEASARYEEEILHFKRRFQQMTSESNSRLQESKIDLQELENKLELEKQECLLLQSNLKQISREYDDYVAAAVNEMQIAKEQMSDLEQALRDEEVRNTKLIEDHESTIVELERSLDVERKKGDSLLMKYEEMQKRAIIAEENLTASEFKLAEADRNMVEMEELVKGSKSELELLKKAVSVDEICIHKSTQSEGQIKANHEKPNSIESRSEILLQEKSQETSNAKYQRKYKVHPSNSGNKPKEEAKFNEKPTVAAGNNLCSWEKAKEHTIRREVYNNNNESRRYNPRFYEKKRFGQQEDNAQWYRENQRANGKDYYSFARPERQQGQLRQHRNSLLRENSRLRYSMSMLNHDCAILNYTLQQVVVEAEQKLEALYSMYLAKESLCASYEAQAQGGLYIPDNTCQFAANTVNQYDPYGIQNAEFVEACPNGSSYVQPGVVYQGNYPYCDGYYEVYPQQDNFATQPAMMEQMQYVQPIYIS